MRGWLGVSRRPSRWRSAALVGGAALGLSCTGDSLLVGEESRNGEGITDDAALDGGVDALALDATTRQCPASLPDRQQVPGCWPTPHVGRYQGFFLGMPRYPRFDRSGEEFPAGGLALVLAEDGIAELTFGGPGARDSCAELSSPRCASVGRLLPGFGYRLEDVELLDPTDAPSRIAGEPPVHVAESMSFSVWLGQPWETWCAGQTLPKANCRSSACASAPVERVAPAGVASAAGDRARECSCDELGCRPNATSLSIRLQMSADRQALRGVYEPSDASFAKAHLELERRPEP